MTFEEAYEYLKSNGIATTEELDLVSGIWGATVSVLDDVCYYRSGEYLPKDDDEDGDEVVLQWECYNCATDMHTGVDETEPPICPSDCGEPMTDPTTVVKDY